jgi:hypothetical protein
MEKNSAQKRENKQKTTQKTIFFEGIWTTNKRLKAFKKRFFSMR